MADSSCLDGLCAALRFSVADETFFCPIASGCFITAIATFDLACISPTGFPTDPFLAFNLYLTIASLLVWLVAVITKSYYCCC